VYVFKSRNWSKIETELTVGLEIELNRVKDI
jgi:hypothetical protein